MPGGLPAYGQKTATGSQDRAYNRIAGRGTPLRVSRRREPLEAGKGKVFAATRSRCGGLAVLVALLCACATAPAWAAVPGGYAVQRSIGPAPRADAHVRRRRGVERRGPERRTGWTTSLVGVPAAQCRADGRGAHVQRRDRRRASAQAAAPIDPRRRRLRPVWRPRWRRSVTSLTRVRRVRQGPTACNKQLVGRRSRRSSSCRRHGADVSSGGAGATRDGST